MSNLGSQVAGGAAWMVGFRFFQRGVGVLSTIILARLLVPEDFGLVAMAMVIYGLLEIFAEFSFDLALIQNQEADRKHYDTAWTLNVIFRGVSASILVLGAPLIAQLFSEPRLEAIVYVLAIVMFVQGLQNIGVVAFRKDFRFNMEFHFRAARKLIAFVVTVTLAYVLQSYWALVFGIMASHAGGTILSYIMHPYRPRPNLSATRELLGFSVWMFVNGLFSYVRQRGPDLLIGRVLEAGSLGVYKVAYEIATLPTTELFAPIMRAVFPGFSRISRDIPRLRQAYLGVQGVVAMIAFPAATTLIVLAGPVVHLLLGDQWVAAIPLIQIVSVFGTVQVLQGNRMVYMALGRPYLVALINFVQGAITLVLMGFWTHAGYGVEGASWALVFGGATILPLTLYLLSRSVGLTPIDFFAVQLRPGLAATVMGGVMWGISVELGKVDGPGVALVHLLGAGLLGAVVYAVSILGMWRLAGCPQGAETRVMELIGVDRFLGVATGPGD